MARLMSMLGMSVRETSRKSSTTRWYPRMSGRRCSRKRATGRCRRVALVMADASATFTCQRQRSVCLGSMREHSLRQRAHAQFRFDGTAMQTAGEMRRKQLQPDQRPAVAGPQRFVRLVAEQHVELGQAVVDGG